MCVFVLCGFCTFSKYECPSCTLTRQFDPNLEQPPDYLTKTSLAASQRACYLNCQLLTPSYFWPRFYLHTIQKYNLQESLKYILERLSLKKVASKEIFLYRLLEKRHFPPTTAGSCHNLERVSICECVHQKDSNKLHS